MKETQLMGANRLVENESIRDTLSKLKRKAWSSYTTGKFQDSAEQYKEIENIEKELGHNSALSTHNLAVSHLHMGQIPEGVKLLIEACNIYHGPNDRGQRNRLFPSLQNFPSYRLLTGALGFSPQYIYEKSRSFNYEPSRMVSEKRVNELFETEVKTGNAFMEGNMEDARNSIERVRERYDESRKPLYYGTIYERLAHVNLQNAGGAPVIKHAVNQLFYAICEDYRFQLKNSNPLSMNAANLLLERFSAHNEFLDFAGRRVRSRFDEYMSSLEYHQSNDEFGFHSCAYFRGNPENLYERWLKEPQLKSGIGLKSDRLLTTPEKVRKEDEKKTRRAARVDQIIQENKRKLNDYLVSERKVPHSENQLIVLRRWNSIHPRNPIVPSDAKGGGFFLIWQGKGIVIDPGYDFLANMLKCGYSINDIDLILVTHAHDDHTGEIEVVYSLDYKAHKLRQQLKNLFLKGITRTHMITDQINEKNIASPNARAGTSGTIPLFGSEGCQLKYSSLLANSWSLSATVSNEESLWKVNSILKEYKLELRAIRTVHNEMPWMQNPTGLGFILTLRGDNRNHKLGFTGDTMHHDQMNEFFAEIDILVVNLGSYKEKKSDHLGEIGAATLLRKTSPKLALITEFGQELESIRDIVTMDISRRALNVLTAFPYGYPSIAIPADIGLAVKITEDGLQISHPDLQQDLPPQDVQFRDPTRKRGQHNPGSIKYSPK